jgi:hypothetical protein
LQPTSPTLVVRIPLIGSCERASSSLATEEFQSYSPPQHGDEGDIAMIMIPGDLDYRYDRRVNADFLELFDARGAFRTLTEYACKARYLIDLQFRRNPINTSAERRAAG